MALTINSNIASLTAQKHIERVTRELEGSSERLATGKRINSAKDDAAGLAMATRLTSKIRGINQAKQNVNDAISVIEGAEGHMEEVSNILQSMRDLASQAGNSTITSSDRSSLVAQFSLLAADVGRIASTADFNSDLLFDAGYSSTFQVGPETTDTFAFDIESNFASATFQATTASTTMVMASLDLSTSVTTAATALSQIDLALTDLGTARAKLGINMNSLESISNSLSSQMVNSSDARSRIMDADIAAEASMFARNSILQQAGTAILAQANQQPALALLLLG